MKNIISWKSKEYVNSGGVLDGVSLVVTVDDTTYDFGLLDVEDLENVYVGLDSLRLSLFDTRVKMLKGKNKNE